MIFRLKVFIPVLVVVVSVSALAFFRLDLFVKSSLENAISAATGTKTDISHLRISFVNSSLKIRRLEIASSQDFMKNAVEFGDIVIDFQFLPLLHKRMVVDRFSITGIQWDTPRRTSGELPVRRGSQEPGLFSEISDAAMAGLKEEFAKLPVSKLTDFEIPNDPAEVLKKIDLSSLAVYKDAGIQIQAARSQWMSRYREIRDLSEYRQMMVDGRALVATAPQNPDEILARIQQAEGLIQKIQKEKSDLQNLVTESRAEYERLNALIIAAQKAVIDDTNRAKDLVGFEAFDPSTITRMIFGTQWVERAERVLRFQNLLRSKLSLMAAQGKDDSIQIRPRARGRDIIFVTPERQPGFVMAASDFSVNVLHQGRREQIDEHYGLKLRDINSAPKLYGKPMTLDLKMEFKDRVIGSAQVEAVWDYTKEAGHDQYKAVVNRIKAENWPVGIPRFFPVKIESGEAQAKLQMDFRQSEMVWVNDVRFSKVGWNFSQVPKSGALAPILFEVFQGAKDFWLRFQIQLKDGELHFDVTSDLDSKLKEGISRYLQMRAQEFLARLQREIDGRVSLVKAQATDELAKFSGDIDRHIVAVYREVSQYAEEAEGFVGQLQHKAKAFAEQKLKDQVSDQIQKNLPKNLPKLKF